MMRVAVDLVGATCSLFCVNQVCSVLMYSCALSAAVWGFTWVEVIVMSSA